MTAERLADVVRDIAVDAGDGVVLDTGMISVQEIREQADYSGLRDRHRGMGRLHRRPDHPAPRRIRTDRVLGDPIELLGYAPETTIAEKGVTVLERGITSFRWRDYVDIVQLARQGIDAEELLRSARAVARNRGVVLEPVGRHLAGCGDIGQPKWAAWRRKEQLEAVSEDSLDDQAALVAFYLDPIVTLGPA